MIITEPFWSQSEACRDLVEQRQANEESTKQIAKKNFFQERNFHLSKL